jgi:hypothetical protein
MPEVPQEFSVVPRHQLIPRAIVTDNRGRIPGLSGRASRRAGRLDLVPPGGGLPTYACAS